MKVVLFLFRLLLAAQIVSEATTTVPPPCELVADIGVIMDSSSSIGTKNYEIMKDFVKNVVGAFDIKPDKVRVALVTYNSVAKIKFNFDKHSNNADVKSAIEKIQEINIGTYTNLGLIKARTKVFSTAREGVPKIAIVLTDGLSSKSKLTKDEARRLRNSGVTVFCIGIGNYVSPNEVNAIASDPDKGHSFRVNNFQALNSIKDTIKEATCSEATTTVPPPCELVADIGVIMDSSSSIGTKSYEIMKDFVKNVVGAFDIKPDKVRVALVTYNSVAKIKFNFDKHSNNADVKSAIEKIQEINVGTYTNLGLIKARTKVFSTAREGVPKIAIVLTDGQSRKPKLTRGQARRLRNSGVTVFCIGIGNYVSTKEVNAIASNPDSGHSFKVDNFQALNSIKDTINEATCQNIMRTE